MQRVQQAMEAEYNDSQMSAVTAGLDRSPVILIQAHSNTLPEVLSFASCNVWIPLRKALCKLFSACSALQKESQMRHLRCPCVVV